MKLIISDFHSMSIPQRSQKNMSSKVLNSYVFMSFILFFTTFIAMFTPATSSNTPRFTNETDQQALIAIKANIVADPSMFLSSWNVTTHLCNWKGIKCSLRHQRVIGLNLSSLQLTGSVSPSIGNLTFLKTFILDNNFFRGEIPGEIGQLFRLQHISLYNNSFRGEIPGDLSRCPDLRFINFDMNLLQGKIPVEISSLPRLLELNLSSNRLTGIIPGSLGNLSSLLMLCLSENNLEGSIPAEIGKLSHLEYLELSSNLLSGPVPMQLFSLSPLRYLMLAFNNLSGTFPSDMGLALPKLHTVSVGGNKFTGPIPASITNASGLTIFDISMNAFTGPIPLTWGSLKHLQRLNLGGNNLGSSQGNDLKFFNSLSNCTDLRILHLYANHLKGDLPDSVANLSTKLGSLRLDQNYISGLIPEGIGSLINLYDLALSGNNLSGTIPHSIGKLINLQGLDLSANNLFGEIPSSFGNITFLSILEMQENMLEGRLPVSLGNCRRLERLDLSHNQLTGAIPGEIFGIFTLTLGLNLAHNLFSGDLPSEVGNLINLLRLNISYNKLSGELPSALGNCEALQFLSVQGNGFQGSIPQSLELLGSIQILDLSHNSFSGVIPEGLGMLIFIEQLDLSFNMLEGEVPNKGVFKNSSVFSIAENGKLCGEIRSISLPACPKEIPSRKNKKKVSSFENDAFCGVGFFLLMISLVLLAYELAIRYCARHSKAEVSTDSLLGNQYPQVSYAELLQATNNFSPAKLIGKGRYGTVYKGILNISEHKLAVKVLNLQRHGAIKSFVAECEALMNIRHRNIVKIVTSCSGTDSKGNEFKALVYELLSNGSLESWLHPSPPFLHPRTLNLMQRLNIAIDVASALDYLHHSCEIRVIHRDIKPSNILLDDDLCAHLGDFGSARSLLVPSMRSTYMRIPLKTMAIIGTIGYVALEYGMGGPVSTLVDVYSYGILLLEMFTGKRPTNSMFKDNLSLHNYVSMSLPDRVMDIVDPLLLSAENESNMSGQSRRHTNGEEIAKCLASVFHIGVTCSAQSPNERMDIADALVELHSIRDALLSLDTESYRI